MDKTETRGRKKTEVNFDKLDALLQFKVTKAFCADYLDVSEDTIDRRIKEIYGLTFSDYHSLKMQRTSLKLQQKAIESAFAGNSTMLIFCLKNIAGWSDKLEEKLDMQSIKIILDKSDLELK